MPNTYLGPSNFAVLALLGGVVLWTLQLIYGARRHKGYDQLYVGLNVVGWILVFMGLAPIFSVSLLGFPMLAALAIVSALIVDRYRKAERKSLLWSLAIAAEKGYPLAPAARAFADERSDELGRRAHHLADLLELGAPLEVALEQSGTPLSPEGVLAIRVHGQTGSLPAALREAAAGDSSDDPAWDNLIERLVYMIVLYGTAATIFVGIMLFIVPTFEEIFRDFDMELPGITQFVIQTCHMMAKYSYLLFLPWLIVVAIVVGGIGYYMGWIEMELPYVSWWFRGFESARVLRMLARGVENGFPLDKMLALVADTYPRPISGGALRTAASDVTQGGAWTTILENAGFLSPSDGAFLRAAERTGTIPWALRETADSHRRRIVDRLNFVSSIVLPGMILLIAIPIAMIAIGMIAPLASLISRLAL